MPLTYENSGVDYGPLDAFKRACQKEAATTVSALVGHGLTEPKNVRGESAYLIETPEEFLAHVEEGLGTKNLVADAMLARTGKSFYANIGIDTVATIVNDLITCGALPISVAMHAAVGDAGWFSNTERAGDLARVCRRVPKSGSGLGRRRDAGAEGHDRSGDDRPGGIGDGPDRPKSLRIEGTLADGDLIVLLESSGVQTNGLTLCRALADRLPDGFQTRMEQDGRMFGKCSWMRR